MHRVPEIGWCDYAWSIFVGCKEKSSGCAHCWAKRHACRHAGRDKRYEWGKPKLILERLLEPLGPKRKPGLVFVSPMADYFHEDIDEAERALVDTVMLHAERHQFAILTKRPENAQYVGWVPPDRRDLWLGISAEDQDTYNTRTAILKKIGRGMFKFVSLEPLLGPIVLGRTLEWLDWVIVGPETGPGARPCNPVWIRNIRRECMDRGVPIYDRRPGGVYKKELSIYHPRRMRGR